MPANPNLLPVSEADNKATCELTEWLVMADLFDEDDPDSFRTMESFGDVADQTFAAHRLAAEQSKDAAFVAMLEGMKRDSLPGCNAVIYEAIANAKALGKGRVGS